MYWRGPIGSTGLPPINRSVTVRISDYYTFKGEQIDINWMMLDLTDVMRQAGLRAIPPATLLPDEGWSELPRRPELSVMYA